MPKPIIDIRKCTNSGECMAVCPVDVFEKNDEGQVIVKHPENCIGCRACEAACPKGAVEVKDD